MRALRSIIPCLLIVYKCIQEVSSVSNNARFGMHSELIRKVADESSPLDPRTLPVDADHGFIHHEELIEAVSQGARKFTSYDIDHLDMRNNAPNGGLSMNLGTLHGDSERVYDTKFDVALHGEKHYLILDHKSMELRGISDKGMHLCHSDIAASKLKAGDYIIGTGSGGYAEDARVLRWIGNTDHVGPRVKRKIIEDPHSAGLVVIRQAVSVKADQVDRHCAEVVTDTIHPFAMMKSFTLDSLFDSHLAAKTTKGHEEAGMDLFDVHSAYRRKLLKQTESRRLEVPYLAAGNGVRFCDDTILKQQEPYMTQDYQNWDYTNWEGSDREGEAGGNFYFMQESVGGCAEFLKPVGTSLLYNYDPYSNTGALLEPYAPMYQPDKSKTDGLYCQDCMMAIGSMARMVVSWTESQLRYITYTGGETYVHIGVAIDSKSGNKMSFAKSGAIKQMGRYWLTVPVANNFAMQYIMGGIYYEVAGSSEVNGVLGGYSNSSGLMYGIPVYGGKGKANSPDSFYLQSNYTRDTKVENTKMLYSPNQYGMDFSVNATLTCQQGLGFKLSVGGKVVVESKMLFGVRKGISYQSPANIIGDVRRLFASSQPLRSASRSSRFDIAISSSSYTGTKDYLVPGDELVAAFSLEGLLEEMECTLFVSLESPLGHVQPIGNLRFISDAQGTGMVEFRWRVPWHLKFQNDRDLDSFRLVSKHNQRADSRAVSGPISIRMFTQDDTIFSGGFAADEGAVVHPDSAVTVEWNPSQLHHYQQEFGAVYLGEEATAEYVSFELIGESFDEAGALAKRTKYSGPFSSGDVDASTFLNTGSAVLTFPTEATSLTQGHRFYLVVKDAYFNPSQGWSRGYFRFQQAADGALGKSFDPSLLAPDHKVEYSRGYITVPHSDAVNAPRSMERRLGAEVCPAGQVVMETTLGVVGGGTKNNAGLLKRPGGESLVISSEMIYIETTNGHTCRRMNEGRSELSVNESCADLTVRGKAVCASSEMSSNPSSKDPRDNKCVFCHPEGTKRAFECMSYGDAVKAEAKSGATKLACYGIPYAPPSPTAAPNVKPHPQPNPHPNPKPTSKPSKPTQGLPTPTPSTPTMAPSGGTSGGGTNGGGTNGGGAHPSAAPTLPEPTYNGNGNGGNQGGGSPATEPAKKDHNHGQGHGGAGGDLFKEEDVPEPPAVKQTGWLVNRYYVGCNGTKPSGEQILMNVEAVGICKFAGNRPSFVDKHKMVDMYMLTYYNADKKQLWQYFYSGEGANTCESDAIGKRPDDSLNVDRYNMTGKCESKDPEGLIHAVSDFEPDAKTLPEAGFAERGPVKAYYDSGGDCSSNKHVTSYTVRNPDACYEAYEDYNNTLKLVARQDTCETNFTSTTLHEPEEGPKEGCGGKKLGTSANSPIGTCFNNNNTGDSRWGLPVQLGRHYSTFCADGIPFKNKPVGGDDGGGAESNSESSKTREQSSAGLVIGCIFASLFVVGCCGLAYYYHRSLKAKKEGGGTESQPAPRGNDEEAEISMDAVHQSMSATNFSGYNDNEDVPGYDDDDYDAGFRQDSFDNPLHLSSVEKEASRGTVEGEKPFMGIHNATSAAPSVAFSEFGGAGDDGGYTDNPSLNATNKAPTAGGKDGFVMENPLAGNPGGYTDNPSLNATNKAPTAGGKDGFVMENPLAGNPETSAEDQRKSEAARMRLAGFAKVSGGGGISIGRKSKKMEVEKETEKGKGKEKGKETTDAAPLVRERETTPTTTTTTTTTAEPESTPPKKTWTRYMPAQPR